MKIYLPNGDFTLVSDSDFTLVVFDWAINNRGHVEGIIHGKKRLMHSVVAERMGLNIEDKDVVFIDGDFLNNQRNNLKTTTYFESKNGVCWNTRVKKWQAQIGVDDRHFYLGYFDDPEDAYKAYDRAFIVAVRHCSDVCKFKDVDRFKEIR